MDIPWNSTQFPGQGKKESNTIVIGLDFGTSSSKVVLHNRSANVAFAIPFGSDGHPSNRFLLPTRPYFNRDGKLCLSSINDGIPLRELKSALIGNPSFSYDFVLENELQASPTLLAAAYLGQVIRLARVWFLTKQKAAFGHVSIDWHLNLGIPSTGNHFHSKKNSFRDIAVSAWWLSTQEGDITMELARKALEIVAKTRPWPPLTDIHPDNIKVIPEIVAEAIGYVQSPQVNQGLHLLIDIGAGTIDIASFNLYSDGGSNQYPILTGEVHWLGAFELHKHRIANVKNRLTRWLDQLGKNEDPVRPIPSSVDSYLPTADKLDIRIDREMDSVFYEQCMQAVQATMIYLRKRRDPHSPHWETGIPTFLCGGGSQTTFYEAALQEVSNWWKKNQTAGLKTLKLPKPDHLQAQGLAESEYHRLAVAYGLSFPEYDIGGIKPPSEIQDVRSPESPKDYTDDFISKDQI